MAVPSTYTAFLPILRISVLRRARRTPRYAAKMMAATIKNEIKKSQNTSCAHENIKNRIYVKAKILSATPEVIVHAVEQPHAADGAYISRGRAGRRDILLEIAEYEV